MNTVFLMGLARANWLPILFAMIALMLVVKGVERVILYVRRRIVHHQKFKDQRNEPSDNIDLPK